MTDQQQQFRLVRIVSVERGENRRLPCCHFCGTEIKHLYFIRDEQGKELVVGSECVVTLLSGADLARAKNAKRNIAKAVKEWKAQVPAPLKNETREAYISRRVTELENRPLAVRKLAVVTSRNLYTTAQKRLAACGLDNPYNYARPSHYQDASYQSMGVNKGHEGYEYDCPLCQQRKAVCAAYGEEVKAEQYRIIQEVAASAGANPYDLGWKQP